MRPRFRRTLVIGIGAILVAGGMVSCGDPFTQPACYGGPGCGQDDVPPVGTVIAPAYGAMVQCPFQLEVTATDNIGVKGVDFFLEGFPLTDTMITRPPYRLLVDPTFVHPVPGSCAGTRDLTVLVHDVADNVDTVDFQVYYTRPTKRPWPCPVTDTLC